MSDLIIKGAGEIKDGLYNIKDGKLFKYKANGGTVRTYPIISADRPKWIPCSERLPKVRQWVLCQCRAGIMDVLRLTAGGSWGKNYPHTEYMGSFVVAWMPLPEAYKESDADGSD